MSIFFRSFFLSLMSPLKMLDYYLDNIPLPEEEGEDLKLKLSESILCAWSFHIGNAIISVAFYFLMSTSITSSITEFLEIADKVIPRKFLTPHAFFIFSLAQDMILFPLFAYLGIKLSTLFIRFYAFVLGDNIKDSDIESVFNIALSSHTLSIIPIVGVSFQKLFYWFYFFLGTRKLFKGSNFIAFMVVVSPYILLFFFMSFLVSLVTFSLFS